MQVQAAVAEQGVSVPHLARLRIRQALSQAELAKLAGVSRPTIIAAERGERIKLRNVRKLAAALAVAPHELMSEEA